MLERFLSCCRSSLVLPYPQFGLGQSPWEIELNRFRLRIITFTNCIYEGALVSIVGLFDGHQFGVGIVVESLGEVGSLHALFLRGVEG